MLFAICFVLFHNVSTAQHKKDTIGQVTIFEKKINIEEVATQTIDSNLTKFYQHTSIHDLLQWHSNVFVKNYGVGNLSTISIRGSSAAQTKVLWHGINLNSAMTGISDFSTLPVSFFDKMEIDYSSDENNSSISGSLSLLNNKPIFQKKTKLCIAAGYESLQNYNLNLSLLFSGINFSNTFKVSTGYAMNKYSFHNTIKEKEIELQHANSKQINLMNDFYLKMNPNNLFSFHLWIYGNQRQIPAASFEEKSEKLESNLTARSLLQWDRQRFNLYHMVTTLGVLYERYTYGDSFIHFQSKASVVNIPYAKVFTYTPRNHHKIEAQLTAGNSFLIHQQDASLLRAGLQLNYQADHIFKRINAKASLLKEVSDLFQLPVAGSLSFNVSVLKGMKLYGTISSNNRMPTLNELYFNPGGNKNLKPETSKNVEGGLQYHKNTRRHFLHSDMSFYNRNVNNWILWYGSSILTPHNIQQVRSRGVEVVMDYEYLLNKPQPVIEPKIGEADIIDEKGNRNFFQHSRLCFGLIYAYTLSTTEKSAIENDYSIGKQIPYVPRYQVKTSIGFKSNKMDFQFLETYTGYRFVTTDETQYLKPYWTGNIFASYKMKVAKKAIQLTLRCNNIFNANYESIVGRIMPRRNFSVGGVLNL